MKIAIHLIDMIELYTKVENSELKIRFVFKAWLTIIMIIGTNILHSKFRVVMRFKWDNTFMTIITVPSEWEIRDFI